MARRRPPRATSTEAPPGIWLARPESPGPGRALAVKDLFDTAGLTTTYGSAVFRDHVPGRSAEAVRLLERAGWADVGKANLHEFAYGITSQNPHYGTVPNPARPGRTAGGSSGGNAAALAAGLCEGALGTDTGGSIRIPAACCGMVGLKPTHGLISMDGCFPLAPSFDHAGPMARSVGVCAEMIAALAPGFESLELDSLDEIEIGVAWLDRAEPAIREAIGRVTSMLANARSIELPLADHLAPVFMREVAETHERLYADHRGLYGDNVATKVERCLAVSDSEYARAAGERAAYRELVAEVFDRVDLLLTPTLASAPHPADVDELAIRGLYVSLTLPFNAVGAPALALPCGDASVQLVAAPGRDALVLAAGALLADG